MIPLTERLLNDAGGWQVMKAARGLHGAGRVTGAQYEPPMLTGLVREGTTQYKAGLKIESKTNIENQCTCRDSRIRGLICAHSIAVGLEVLKPTPAPAAAPVAAPVPEPAAAIPTDGCLRAKSGVEFAREGRGEPVQLCLIVPPNFPDAFRRGVAGLGVECLVKGARKLCSALEKNRRYLLDESDFQAMAVLLRMSGGELPGMIQLTKAQADEVLASFVGHPRVTIGRDRPLRIQDSPQRLSITVAESPTGDLKLQPAPPAQSQLLVGAKELWLWNSGSLDHIAVGLPSAYLALFNDNGVTIPAAGVGGFALREAPALRQYFDLPEITARPQEISHRPEGAGVQFALKVEGSLNHLAAELESIQNGRRTTISSPGYRPGNAAEVRALARLRGCGFDGPNPRGEFILKGESAILTFFAKDLPQLKELWKVEVGSRFENVTENLELVKPRFEVQGSGQNWFEVTFDLFTEGGERLSASEIRKLLASGKRTVKLRNNKSAVITPDLLDDFSEILQDTNPGQQQPGRYRFDTRDAAYLKEFTDRRQGTFAGTSGANWGSDLPFANRPAAANLGAEWETLRSYQRDGVTWLSRLYANGLAGILADEMGLGKTVQALAFLSTIPGPKLVVCPASLTLNWQREAQRFAPQLDPCVINEVDAHEVPALVRQNRLLITSYGLLRRDIEVFRSQVLGGIVLDEAQQIKNPESQTAQAAHRLRANAKVVLTGTPIENGVRDIWSSMQFLMPGFLGSRESFKERFESPIRERPGGPEHMRLVRRLKPFILRRTKAVVASEIPAKIEQVSYCELSRKERDLYAQFLTAARQMMHQPEAGGQKAPKGGKLAVFTALLRLRQVCCDPRLLSQESEPESGEGKRSAKLELLMELLGEAIEDGHRILVFSQFASMLRLIGAALKDEGHDYCYLDGSTRHRQAEVDRFQNGNAPVFLISLKAGGFGLNLTAADTVIHYDPWWNPAVEAQATDRVHRIGQTRSVNIYKLVARGTVEEKILALQAKKREIAGGFIGDDEQPTMSELEMSDLEDLIA